MAKGVLRVTIPRGGTLAYASSFAQRNTVWVSQQLARAHRREVWWNGGVVMFRGVPTALVVENGWVRLGALHFGPQRGELRPFVEGCLRSLAEVELRAATMEWAARLGIEVRGCQVRDQRTRWGSCSSKGVINLNWRLIQTPEFVRDYIIVHELMHRREMNHSTRFWAHVAAAFPNYQDAERWLRKNASLLR